MSKNAVNRVKEAVGSLTAQIESKSGEVVDELVQTGNETLDKFDKVKKVITAPLKEANSALDELLYGDNGAPADGEEAPSLEDEFQKAMEGRPASTLSKPPQQ